MANIEHYPFQMYIHWQPAEKYGEYCLFRP